VNSSDEYRRWLSRVWSAREWETLPGYSRDEVRARRDRYLEMRKAGAGLAPSFDAYHDEVLQPWVGEEFFSSRPRVGIYLREFPLPCLDRTPGLLPGHEGRSALPAEVMRESVEAVMSGNRAYRTVAGALEGSRKVLETCFGLELSSLEEMMSRVVFADWVRPFAMFSDDGGGEFEQELSKRSCHTKEMYELAGKKFAEELEVLSLDLVVVMGLGYFDLAWGCLEDCLVWPEQERGAFRTLRGPPPDSFRSSPGTKVMVLPHPATNYFQVALERLGAAESGGGHDPSDGYSPGALFDDEGLEHVLRAFEDALGPAIVQDREKSRYRRMSWKGASSVYVQREGGGWTIKSKDPAPADFSWKIRSERDHPTCVHVPDGTSAEEVRRLVQELTRDRGLRDRAGDAGRDRC
jgi:hypothetical protein